MTARKTSLRKFIKNPITYLVREDIGEWKHNTNSYNEINICANLYECKISLYNTKLPFLNRPDALDICFEWKWFEPIYYPNDSFSLKVRVEKLVQNFQDQKVSDRLVLTPTKFPLVKV